MPIVALALNCEPFEHPLLVRIRVNVQLANETLSPRLRSASLPSAFREALAITASSGRRARNARRPVRVERSADTLDQIRRVALRKPNVPLESVLQRCVERFEEPTNAVVSPPSRSSNQLFAWSLVDCASKRLGSHPSSEGRKRLGLGRTHVRRGDHPDVASSAIRQRCPHAGCEPRSRSRTRRSDRRDQHSGARFSSLPIVGCPLR